MKDKKRRIITEAKNIFRKKGYLLTSVADIVEASGISKGTFYNYFTSKEELAIVIFKQEYSVLYQKLDRAMGDQAGGMKENFASCVELLITFHTKNAEILNISFSQAMIDDDFNQFLASVRLRSLEWIKNQILLVYGEDTRPYVNDLTMLLTGMTFMFVFATSKTEEGKRRIQDVVKYVLNRMDAVVGDLKETGDILITEQDVACFIPSHLDLKKRRMVELRKTIDQLLGKIEEQDVAESDKWQYKESLNALLSEINNRETPRDFMIQGALLYLKQQAPKALDREIQVLEMQINSLL
ncbi:MULTISPECIES: TetR/AcrR family transcriptional regulator [Listeria]|uniref:TetR/AcrR family transcriptional regulator n=1 Tax=Listeria TaxID=1637 RepID=UPI000B5963F1|nr:MULTISPECIES: TetR/AcrR family transcriptional regulator [Listeria]